MMAIVFFFPCRNILLTKWKLIWNFLFWDLHYHIKLTDTNKNTNGKFLSEDCDELYQQNSPSLYLSVNTDENILLVYTEEFIEGKKIKKTKRYNDVLFIQTKLPMKWTR